MTPPERTAGLDSTAAPSDDAAANGASSRVSTAPVADSRPAAAQLLLATLPFGLLLVGYAVAAVVNGSYAGQYVQGAQNAVGFTLHITEPARFDQWLFGGLPTTWLQQHLYAPGQVHWYDAVVAVVYFAHYLVSPAIAVVLWYRDRARFRAWVGCALGLAALGLITYVVYPMAPPWLAARAGGIGPVSRISSVGWDYLHIGLGGTLVNSGQSVSNLVAAMPSLHVAFAALVAAFLSVGATWWKKALLACYPLTMTFAVVYAGEHYVVDAIVGTVYALAVVAGWRLLSRRSQPAR